MSNSKKTVARRALFALLVALTFISGGWAFSNIAKATTGINQRINFQATSSANSARSATVFLLFDIFVSDFILFW
jgi:ribosome-associated toxin RatA of RatAB toxin-antitoxin module